MESQIIESKYSAADWFGLLGQPVAQRLLAWEQDQADTLLADVFGYHALQLGCPQLQALRCNRMPHQWLAQTEFESWPLSPEGRCDGEQWPTDVRLDSRSWPWPAESLDLVVLPHSLERSADPHACLREVERVLIPEGHVLITGLNPMSLWGWRQAQSQRQASTEEPFHASLIAYRRLRDWLRLLGFEVQVSRFGGWSPALSSERWMQRLAFMESCGQRWWPILGGVYLIVATKRMPGGRWLDGRSWRAVRLPTAATAPVVRSDTFTSRQSASKDFS